MTLTQFLKDNPLVRWGVDLLFARGDFVRPITQVPYIRRALGNKPLGMVLDNGCGRGMYTPILLPRAQAYWGVDIGAHHIETMQRRFRHWQGKAHFRVASATQLPFENETFDTVLFCEVLEHIEDHEAALAEVHRVLKPGGRLVLSVPVPPAPIDDKEHVREGYTLAELEALLIPAGFEIKNHQYCLFGISKAVIRLTANLGWPLLPAMVKWPLYLEAPLGLRLGTPYDIVLEIEKPPVPVELSGSVAAASVHSGDKG